MPVVTSVDNGLIEEGPIVVLNICEVVSDAVVAELTAAGAMDDGVGPTTKIVIGRIHANQAYLM